MPRHCRRHERARVTAAVAVAGTATQSAGIDLGAEGLDVEGHVLPVERLRAIRDRLAAVPLAERRQIPGLDPDRAPTIVAGVVVLLAALDAFGLERGRGVRAGHPLGRST